MSNTIGWGKGVSNNLIGWGNVGTNGFGSIYNRSNSGETILKDPNFIIEVDTSIAGVSNTDQFQFTGAVGEYDVEAYQNDNLVASFNDLVNEQTITLPSAGVYELRVIPKEAGFDKLKFNNSGDKDKLLKVLQWGLYGVNEPNQSSAFNGCNLTQIPDGGAWFDVVTNGSLMFNINSLTSLPSGMELPNLSSGFAMFIGNSLTSLPSGMELPNLSSGIQMFRGCSLTSLPSSMVLPNLSRGLQMFLGSTINTERYSQLLIDLEEFNPNNNVAFHGGNSKYNAQGQIARDLLIARGWTITDGGAENVFQTATVAYSLRDLGLGATNVVRVRRSTDNAEQDFSATEITDGSLTTFCGAGDGFVSVWYDQSLNQNNLINSIALSQARVVDAGSLVLDNGKPAVKFNLGNVMETLNAYPTLNFQNHFYVANSTGSNDRILDTRGTGAAGTVKGWQSKFSNPVDVTAFDDGLGNLLQTQSISRTSQNLVTVLGSQSSLEEYTNSILEKSATGNVGSFDSGNKLYVSGNADGQNTQRFVGTIQEIICFNTDKSAERPDIETNINDYYAIY